MQHRAWIVTSVVVTDRAAFAEYRDAVAQVNAKLGGTMLARGAVADVLAGEGEPGEIVVVLGFDDEGQARDYIASSEYRSLEPLRDRAGRFTIRLVG